MEARPVSVTEASNPSKYLCSTLLLLDAPYMPYTSPMAVVLRVLAANSDMTMQSAGLVIYFPGDLAAQYQAYSSSASDSMKP